MSGWEQAFRLLDPARSGMPAGAREVALRAKGFLAEVEGQALFSLAAEASARAPCLEVGSYCGKSTVFLAAGCRVTGAHPLFAVDHHQGSVEQQPGQQYHDPELFDPRLQRVSTFGPFLTTLREAGLEDWVIPVVTTSTRLARSWPGAPLSLVFIDGGHAEEDVQADVEGWAPKVISGGYLCMHDLFADPAKGGQAPFRSFERIRKSAGWTYVTRVETLGILRRR
ncbi:MAG TPA: class I SAM-dependent methyltransferase [Myxococcaceae bacterium]|jgi:hypothetical protein